MAIRAPDGANKMIEDHHREYNIGSSLREAKDAEGKAIAWATRLHP